MYVKHDGMPGPTLGEQLVQSLNKPSLHVCERRAHVVAFLRSLEDRELGSIFGIETMRERELRATSVEGTALELVADALADAGYTEVGTAGNVMDICGFDRGTIHTLVCDCRGDITVYSLADGIEQCTSYVVQG